jgi:putative transposase
MMSTRSRYRGHRFPPEIIGYAVWAYHRFCLSFRDVEDLLAERGIIVSYEGIRQWCRKFGPDYARRLKKKQGRLGDTWYLDELFVRINGQRQYLWRAVDQDDDVIDILLQSRRDQRAAERFLRRLLRGQGKQPFRIITDKRKSYTAASRTILPGVTHDTEQYANNRAEISHQPIRMRERQMRRFKSRRQAQRFLSLHGVVWNLFCVARHLLRSIHQRLLRSRSFEVWRKVTAKASDDSGWEEEKSFAGAEMALRMAPNDFHW